MAKIEVNTIDTISGSTNLTIGSTNSSTVTFENGSCTGHMYPAFKATGTTQTNIATNTATKLQFDTEVFDTDNCYDATTNYRFTPTVAGKYLITATIQINDDSDTDVIYQIQGSINKNGTAVETTLLRLSADNSTFFNVIQLFNVTSLQEANGSTDYFEVYAKFQGSSSVVDFQGMSFQAFRIGS